MKALALSLATLGLASAAIAPAHAAEAENMRVTISAGDLNLASPADQRVLNQRVEKAVRTVCRVTSLSTGSRILTQEAQNCLAKARADAQRQMAALISKEQRGG